MKIRLNTSPKSQNQTILKNSNFLNNQNYTFWKKLKKLIYLWLFSSVNKKNLIWFNEEIEYLKIETKKIKEIKRWNIYFFVYIFGFSLIYLILFLFFLPFFVLWNIFNIIILKDIPTIIFFILIWLYIYWFFSKNKLNFKNYAVLYDKNYIHILKE